MTHEDRLEALLALRLRGEGRAAVTPPEEDAAVVAALAAADHLLDLRFVEPEDSFARNLETRLLTHAQSLAPVTLLETPMTGRGGVVQPGSADHAAGRRPAKHRTRVLWPLIAASLALVMGIGTITGVMAAAAPPGSPLYALHRWEQGVQAQLAANDGDRVQLHLANARAALASLDAAVAHHTGDPTYSDALTTLRSEDHAAAKTLQKLSPGSERDTLTAQLQTLRQQERSDLYAALRSIAWADQLATTQALGGLGAAIPQVTSVTLEQNAPSDEHSWKVTITGSGFEPGAELVGGGGTVVGQVITSGPTQLIVDISDRERHFLEKDAGVRNADGTAAALTALTEARPRKGSAQGPQETPSPGGSDNGNSGGPHSGGGHQPTPSPSVLQGR